jgi:hypothetical protein
MGIGEADPLRRQLVEVRRADLRLWVERGHVAHPWSSARVKTMFGGRGAAEATAAPSSRRA